MARLHLRTPSESLKIQGPDPFVKIETIESWPHSTSKCNMTCYTLLGYSLPDGAVDKAMQRSGQLAGDARPMLTLEIAAPAQSFELRPRP